MKMYCFRNQRFSSEDRVKEMPCVFLDRDGVVIRNMHYLKDPGQIYFPDGVFAGLRRMRRSGCRLILISNQSGIGRGYFTEEDLLAVHTRMNRLLEEEDVFLDACYYCPHAPEEQCSCRKPAVGMLEKACEDFAVNRGKSWMIGDSGCDMELARNFRIPGILISESPERHPEEKHVCRNLMEAADIVRKYTSL